MHKADFVSPKLQEARLRSFELRRSEGGEGGIRTHGDLAVSVVFKTTALGRYATSPSEARTGIEPVQ